jgi:hypothetical protein
VPRRLEARPAVDAAGPVVYRRLSAADAVSRVRELRACSIETDGQEEAVAEWALLMEEVGYRLGAT